LKVMGNIVGPGARLSYPGGAGARLAGL